MSRGKPEIWKNFGCKSLNLKDRRYCMDQQEVINTVRFNQVDVSSIFELRAEIELTPSVDRGKNNRFKDDGFDALVGAQMCRLLRWLAGCSSCFGPAYPRKQVPKSCDL